MSTALKQVFLGGSNPKETRDHLASIVKKSLTDKSLELEAIVHGNTGEGNEEISMDQYQRVIGFLRGVAEQGEHGEEVYMNITGTRSNIRATIRGDSAISDYCVEDRLPGNTEFMQKRKIKMPTPKKGEKVNKHEYYEYKDYGIGYRVNLKMEDDLRKEDPMVRDIQAKWGRMTKTFRLIQRESFYIGMFRIDCSRIRQGRGNTIEESGCLDTVASYEIEIELVKDRIPEGTSEDTILKSLMKSILRIMRVLRNTWFLLRDERVGDIISEYGKMTGQEISPKFIGPMPITLSRQYLSDIRSGEYTATMKADGERALFMITPKGEGYLMFRTMKVEDTGMLVDDKTLHDTILDGEIITQLKDPKTGVVTSIHPPMYLVFDCYRAGGKNIYTYPLLEGPEGSETRLGVASVIVDALGGIGAYESRWGDDKHVMNVSMKPFVMVRSGEDTETSLRKILDRENVYETDGIVFTPNRKAVNNCRGETLANIRGTWEDVMKWKPPQDNTIDFLLKLEPDKKMTSSGEYYKEGIVCVFGNDMNASVLYELQMKNAKDIGRELRSRENTVVPFYGGDHRIQLFLNESGAIIAKSGDIVEDGMIIECVWDPTKPSSEDDRFGGWVIRNVRWDKTAMYRKGVIGGTMNNDRTAKSVWETSVSDRLDLEDLWDDRAMYVDSPDGGDEDTGGYFNSRGKRQDSVLARMRDFHNLIVKKYLISPKKQYTNGKKIVDLACGKGGDIPRYQDSGASFVFGLDIEPDNILNVTDGAIRRYIGYKGRKVSMRFALADCGKDLFAADTAGDEQSREIIGNMFNTDGLMSGGADKIVCMFAMHYFFRTESTLDTFFSNVNRILRPKIKDDAMPPCFVSCYFDSKRVHTLLSEKGKIDESTGNVVYRSMTPDGELAWSIEGLYDLDTVPVDGEPEGVGLEIKVYIRSINKAHNEYLVGRNTFRKACESHGLKIVEKENGTIEDSKKAGYVIPGTTFDRLFGLIKEGDRVGKARDMSENEKELSFLYRWDIVLKV